VEQKERLLAVDKDEEEEPFVEEENTDLKNPGSGAETFRKLICVDEASKVIMLLRYNNPINPIIMICDDQSYPETAFSGQQ